MILALFKMYLLLLELKMKINNLFFQFLCIWLSEILFLDLLSINNIRPDFLVILVLYWSIKFGRTIGIILGFIIGMVVDFTGTASFFGLSPLIFSITGYLSGNLKGLYNKVNPVFYTLLWILIIFIQAFIFSLIHNQNLIVSDLSLFFKRFFGIGSYTLMFIILIQLLYPLHKIKEC